MQGRQEQLHSNNRNNNTTTDLLIGNIFLAGLKLLLQMTNFPFEVELIPFKSGNFLSQADNGLVTLLGGQGVLVCVSVWQQASSSFLVLEISFSAASMWARSLRDSVSFSSWVRFWSFSSSCRVSPVK